MNNPERTKPPSWMHPRPDPLAQPSLQIGGALGSASWDYQSRGLRPEHKHKSKHVGNSVQQQQQRMSQRWSTNRDSYHHGQQSSRGNHEQQARAKGFINIFMDDAESTRQFTRCDNHNSTDNLTLALSAQHGRHMRQSQNIHTANNNTQVTHTDTGHKSISTVKSASGLGYRHQVQSIDEEGQEVRQLLRQISKAEQINEGIREENIQLRLRKLSSAEQSVQMLAIRLEMQDLRRKIDRLKAEMTALGNTHAQLQEMGMQSKLKSKWQCQPSLQYSEQPMRKPLKKMFSMSIDPQLSSHFFK